MLGEMEMKAIYAHMPKYQWKMKENSYNTNIRKGSRSTAQQMGSQGSGYTDRYSVVARDDDDADDLLILRHLSWDEISL